MKLKNLIPLLFFICASNLYAQTFLQEISSESEVIVEGEVVNQSVYEYHGVPYTLSYIKITKQLKGEIPNEIQLLSPLKNENGTTTGIKYIDDRDFGVFFLLRAESNKFKLTNDLHGFIIYFEYGEEPKAYSQKVEINNIYNDLLFPVSQLTGVNEAKQTNRFEEKLNTISGGEDCVEYYIHNLRISEISTLTNSISNYWFEFDISARILGNTLFDLGKSELTFSYSSNVFGQNIYSSGNLVVNKSNELNDYILNVNDVSANKIFITLQNDQTTQTVSNFYTKLFRAKIKIENFDLGAIVSLNVDEDFDLTTYELSNNSLSEVNCNIFNEDINSELSSFYAPFIESIAETRLPAGTREIHSRIEIIGSGFGSIQGNSEVWFNGVNITDVVPLPGDYELWSDDKIIAYVPSNGAMPGTTTTGSNHYVAASGPVKVVVGPMSSNEVIITVPYAAKNDFVTFQGKKTGQPIFLDNIDGNGGYTVYFTQEFASLPPSSQGVSFQDAFKEAVNQWCAATGLHFTVNTTQNVSTIWCDNDIRVGVDFNSSNPHATAFHNNSSVSVSGIAVPCDLMGCAEIEINPNTLQNSSFNEVVNSFLHEIGHAHLLMHVVDFDDLMNLFGGTTLSITPDAKEGSSYIQDKSEELNYSRSDCTTSVNEYDKQEFQFNISSIGNEVIISWDSDLRIGQVRIFDILGRIVLDEKVEYMNNFKTNIFLTQGVYAVQVKRLNGLASSKLFYHEK